MGVYIYKSVHIDAIKIGHYSKNNAWSRVAHRGFNSCICPKTIIGKVNVDDLVLLHWYPTLSPKDEKKIHKLLHEYKLCGEWFNGDAIDHISTIILLENKANTCSRSAAIKTRRRL